MRFKDSELIAICLRGAVLTERERNELNNKGIRILTTKAIGYSSQFIYEGESYDELRKVSKFEVSFYGSSLLLASYRQRLNYLTS